MNQIMIVGRVKELPQILTTTKGNLARMVIEAERNFRNEDGTISSDLFQVTLWRGVAEECVAACRVGNLIAVRGRLKGDIYEKNNTSYYNTEIVAEKVSFLERAGEA
jgi:single-strand DNA-binding protein